MFPEDPPLEEVGASPDTYPGPVGEIELPGLSESMIVPVAEWTVQVPGRANTESSVAAVSPEGMLIKMPVVFSVQNGVGSMPDSAQIVALT